MPTRDEELRDAREAYRLAALAKRDAVKQRIVSAVEAALAAVISQDEIIVGEVEMRFVLRPGSLKNGVANAIWDNKVKGFKFMGEQS